MDKRILIGLTGIALFAAILFGGSGSVAQGTTPKLQSTQQSTEPSELPADTPVLEFDKPLVETLTIDNPSRLYKFQGNADQLVTLSVTPKSGDTYAIINLLDSSLQSILGGADGEALIGGSLIVKLPADGTYVVSVEYGDATPGTPTPGSFEVLLSEFKPKP